MKIAAASDAPAPRDAIPLRERVARQLPRRLLRAWQVERTRRAIGRFAPRTVTHTYHGVPLTVRIADPLAASWYDHDWPTSVLPELEFCRHLVRDGATVFDIGAHYGVVALVMGAMVGRAGRVVAVEANPYAAGIALQNQLLNRQSQLVVVGAAAAATAGAVMFDRLGAAVSRDAFAAVRVPSLTVDQLTATYGQPDLLWVDVEGFECEVLRGAGETLSARPACCVEVHVGELLERQGGSIDEVLAHFGDGYELYVNRAPNDRIHGIEQLERDRAPATRFSLVALPRHAVARL